MDRFAEIAQGHIFRASNAYILENISDISREEVEGLLELLPMWRRSVALALKHDEARRESVLSYLLLAYVLCTEHDITEPLAFDYSAHGKPLLCRHPEICFNMSHCRAAVACAVSDTPVGIDIELRGRYKEMVARRVLSGGEMAHVLAADDSDLAFTTLWTQKEAILKLTGEGIGLDINMQNVISDHPEITLSSVERSSYVCSVATLS